MNETCGKINTLNINHKLINKINDNNKQDIKGSNDDKNSKQCANNNKILKYTKEEHVFIIQGSTNNETITTRENKFN